MSREEPSRNLRVYHFAPGARTRGGISTVVRSYIESDLAGLVDLKLIETHADGAKGMKILTAIKAFLGGIGNLILRPPDAIHVHVGDFPSIYRKMVITAPFLIMRTPSILHFHGAEFIEEYKRKSKVGRAIVKMYMNRFDKVICLSNSWESSLVREFGLTKTIVLPNAVKMPSVRAADRDTTEALNVLFLGLIGDRKGVFDLLDAVEIAVSGDADIHVAVGGNGEVARLLSRVSHSILLKHRVRYLGWISGVEREQAFASAHAFALPSRAEGMPMSIIEAMSYGLPIISCPVGGIPELVSDGQSGILVPPGNPEHLAAVLQRLAKDERGRREMASEAYARVKHRFDLRIHLEQLAGIYKELR